ncbi:MAG: tRNA adenosine(34) deaminase TadA [Proteobacteria bacterium]|nr:tRNA adenosine(34) deaminase TadA [Pseudomonadota bacterium]
MAKFTPEYWMQKAIEVAKQAQELDEVPVGAIIVRDNNIIGQGYNQVITQSDATAHAEIQAIRAAGKQINNYRLINTTLYVTLEPCMMCVGAIVHARIQQIVFAAFDQKTGMAGTRDNCFDKPYHNHKVTIIGGILEINCAQLLQQFFKARRNKSS